MSPPPQPTRPSGPPRPPSSGGSGSGGASTIDPVKILHKYKFVLLGAVFMGIVVGLAAHFLFLKFAPVYTSKVIFECSPAEESVEQIAVQRVDETEMDRFMGTQVDRMMSQLVLTKVVSDPRLQSLAPKWSEQYLRGGQIDIVDALEDFDKMVGARTIPRTFLIQLTVSTRDANDAAGLVKMVKEAYLNYLNTDFNKKIVSRRTALSKSIEATGTNISELSDRKARLVREERIDSLESDKSSTAAQLALVNSELVGIQQSLEALGVIKTQDEAQLARETGIEYDSSLRAAVEESIMIQTFKQELKSLETALLSLKADGLMPGHRYYKRLESQIAAHERKIEKAREELLREAFEARLQNTTTTIAQLQAQEADLLTQKEELEEKMTDLTRITEEIDEYDRQIDSLFSLQQEQNLALSDLESAAGITSAQRVSVVETETVPDRPSFPVLFVMVPAGVVLLVGLTSAMIVLFELLDQRVKGPSDIRVIPRAEPIGFVMDASEDPSKPTDIATAFLDTPGSVFAEHFRQIRTMVNKRMAQDGLKTLLVTGTMPGSGATTIITNLAQANVAMGLKVAVVDANMRRPRIHSAYGLEEGPGLSDHIGSGADLDSCIQQVEKGPDIICAGTRSNRHVEHLSGGAIKNLLNELSSRYDLVLIDVAPAIVAGDASDLANVADASLLVVRALSEKRGQVARVARELADCRGNFLGVVVNAVQSAAGGYMRKNIRTTFSYQGLEKTAKPSKDAGSDPRDAA